MAEESGTVQKNSDDETENFEDATNKLTEGETGKLSVRLLRGFLWEYFMSVFFAGVCRSNKICEKSCLRDKLFMKIIQLEHGTCSAKKEAKFAFQWSNKRSHLKKIQPQLKSENAYSPNHGLQLLLPIALLSFITFITALKIMGCKSEEGYKNNFSLGPFCLIVNQYPSYFQLVISINTVAFFLSVARMLVIFNKLPLRPLLLVSSFSMIGAYICIISGP